MLRRLAFKDTYTRSRGMTESGTVQRWHAGEHVCFPCGLQLRNIVSAKESLTVWLFDGGCLA
jgi:hypothetical protein